MLRIPDSKSSTGRDLASLAHISPGETLLEWLGSNRTHILEMMTQVTDETRLRQFQGAAIALAEIISVINKTP